MRYGVGNRVGTRSALRRTAFGGIVAATLLAGAGGAAAATPAPSTDPSAIGNELVPAISVSPDWASSGFAIAMAYATGDCGGSNCLHLWATHDRGASWSRLAATGWEHGVPSLAMGPRGHVVALASGSQVQRSDDGGASWHSVGQTGQPTAGPPFTSDGSLVIAGQGSHDVLLDGSGHASVVPGSGGTFKDMQFAYAPSFPSSGSHAPLLLTGLDSSGSTTAVLQCTVSYACTTPTVIPATQKVSSPATLVMSPGYASDGIVFAVEPTALFKSADGGHTFAPVSLGEPGAAATAVGALVLDPHFTENRTAYAAVLQVFTGQASVRGGVYATKDGGATWARIGSPSPLDHGATSVALAPDGRLFAGYVDQMASGAKGLLCFDGRAWHATCGGAQAAVIIPQGHSGPPPPTPCGSACGAGAAGAGGSGPGGAAAGSGRTGTVAGGAERAGAAVDPKGSGGGRSPIIAVALGLLVVLGGASVVARVRERRRASAVAEPPPSP